MDALRQSQPIRVACDAMCGGLARWLRVLGVDAAYTPDIDDGELVRQALAEQRVVVTSDHKILERRPFTTRELAGVLLPVGLKLADQLPYVVARLGVQIAFPRCTLCNGELAGVPRADVADVVPARSLIWAKRFFRCEACGHVFWEGTHWRRISAVRAALAARDASPGTGFGADAADAGRAGRRSRRPCPRDGLTQPPPSGENTGG